MKRHFCGLVLLLCTLTVVGREVAFGNGKLIVRTVARNAVRIQYQTEAATSDLPDWI